jgi:hypothetical protein
VTVLLFPDNAVLINFAVINRMDLLERPAAGGRQRPLVRHRGEMLLKGSGSAAVPMLRDPGARSDGPGRAGARRLEARVAR